MSLTVFHGQVDELPSLGLNKLSFTPGEQITVTVRGGNWGLQEWIALYVAANPDSSYSYDGKWQYLNGSKTQPFGYPSYPVSLTFSAPMAPGDYNIRYFRENEIANKLATSFTLTVSNPAIYYVATTGHDDTGDGTSGNPYLTIGKGLTEAAADPAGRVVMVMDGVYDERLVNVIPSGTSWAAPFTLKSFNPLGATIRPSTNGNIITKDNTGSYFIIDGFVIDGNLQTSGAGIAFSVAEANWGDIHHVRIINNEIKNMDNDGIFASHCTALEIRGNIIHDVALTASLGVAHGMYISLEDSVIEDNLLYNIARGYGLHFFNDFGGSGMVNNKCRNNILYSVANTSGQAAILASGFTGEVYNNVIYLCKNGIWGTQGGDAFKIYNNTIYDCEEWGIQNTTVTNFVCVNNLVLANTSGQITGATTEVTNITSGTPTDIWVDPNNVDPAAADFHLKVGSAAIDAGTDVPEFSTDIEDNFRSSLYDVGAYEYTG